MGGESAAKADLEEQTAGVSVLTALPSLSLKESLGDPSPCLHLGMDPTASPHSFSFGLMLS